LADTEADNVEEVEVADDTATSQPNWLYAAIAVGVILILGGGVFFFIKRKK
jgi:LPXTG-motif cell wall-anchored protein